MEEMIKNLLNVDAVWDLLDPQAVIFLLVGLVILFVGL